MEPMPYKDLTECPRFEKCGTGAITCYCWEEMCHCDRCYHDNYRHDSSCAVHNAPALPIGKCTCR